MSIAELRRTLEEARQHAEQGDLRQVVDALDTALRELEPRQLLTTTEAARYLGIRSVNTLKLLVRRLGVPYEKHGNRMMIPVTSLDSIQHAPLVEDIRASDRDHDASASLGSEEGLTPEEMDMLEETRPGRLPWEASKP